MRRSDKTISLILRINLNSGDFGFTKCDFNGLRDHKQIYILFKELPVTDSTHRTSQPSFDHRLTLAIYLTAPVWVHQYKRNREFGSIHSSKFHDTFHVSKNLIRLRTTATVQRVSSLCTQPNEHTVFFLRLWALTRKSTYGKSLGLRIKKSANSRFQTADYILVSVFSSRGETKTSLVWPSNRMIYIKSY